MSGLQRRALLSCLCLTLATACSDDGSGDENNSSETSSGDGDGDTTTGDGDGDTTTGDGDGDTTTGDGDGDTTTGDGDGDPGTGDGDGDPGTGDGDGDPGTGDGDGDPTTGDGDGDPNGCGPALIGGCPPVEGEPFQLLSAEITGDCLTLEVEYSGGCEDHSYVPCWGESFLESEPVQANLNIIHDGNNDPCDSIVQDSWTVDIEPLAQAFEDAYQQQGGTVIINIGGQSVDYEF